MQRAVEDEIRQRKWGEAKVLLAPKTTAGCGLRSLRASRGGVIVTPFQDGSSTSLEVLDKMTDIPFLVPSSLMSRESDAMLTTKPWLIAKYGTVEQAGAGERKIGNSS